MFLKKITAFIIITGILISGSANAQQTERYRYLGTNKVGEPILLDTQEIEGTEFKLITRHANKIFKMTFYAVCGDSRLTMTNMETYSESGQLLGQDETPEEITFKSQSASGMGMTYVCRKIGARGW
ncbi:hypothetical protein [Nostoc sp.]|uniref:hypothetical protein n=1 Tax=Nostoc sp. TaxID=1180 RepID=UPI002FF6EAE9